MSTDNYNGVDFTCNFTTLTIGQPFNITWKGGDLSQPARIDVYDGPTTTLTTTATGGSYLWTPDPKVLVEGDYGIELNQGNSTSIRGPFHLAPGNKTETLAPAATASDPPQTNTTATVPSTAAPAENSAPGLPVNTNVAFGIGAGVAAFIILIVLFSGFLLYRRRRAKKSQLKRASSVSSFAKAELNARESSQPREGWFRAFSRRSERKSSIRPPAELEDTGTRAELGTDGVARQWKARGMNELADTSVNRKSYTEVIVVNARLLALQALTGVEPRELRSPPAYPDKDNG